MSNEKAKGLGSQKMSGPDLVYTATSQASAAGGITQYAFVSCFGAKQVTFFVRTAAGVPTLTSSTIDIDPGPMGTLVTGIANENHAINYIVSPGSISVVPGSAATLFGSTNLRFSCDRIAPRVQLGASATGVSCWAVTQWD